MAPARAEEHSHHARHEQRSLANQHYHSSRDARGEREPKNQRLCKKAIGGMVLVTYAEYEAPLLDMDE